MLEIVLKNGDKASCELPSLALTVRTLIGDVATHYGATRLYRASVIVTEGGIYNGRLTTAAREGRL